LSCPEQLPPFPPPSFNSFTGTTAAPPAPAWSRKWSVAHTLGGAKIWFGLEEVAGDKRLVSASRMFTIGVIVK